MDNTIGSTNISKDCKNNVKNDFAGSDVDINVDKGKPGKKPITDKLTPEFLDDLTMLASQKIYQYEIADALGISTRSFYRLIADNQDFIQAYNKGIDNRKYALEKALLKRAEGFTAEEKQTVITEDPEKGTIIKNTVTQKNYVPDTTALIFSLSNLYPEKYKQKVESVNTVNINVKQIQSLPDEELAKLISNSQVLEIDDYNVE